MRKTKTKFFEPIILSVLVVFGAGCFRFLSDTVVINPKHGKGRVMYVETTGYCACQKCCGWKRNWLFQPVYASGPNKGKPKKVGICADGSRAKHGTIAADTRYFPFGTRIYIPGYGMGTVRDRGGAIKGARKLDLFFESHQDALKWGRKKLKVIVYRK